MTEQSSESSKPEITKHQSSAWPTTIISERGRETEETFIEDEVIESKTLLALLG